MTKKITRGSGNVFADIGIENAGEHRIKAELALKIIDIIEKRKLTQTAAAAWIGSRREQVPLPRTRAPSRS